MNEGALEKVIGDPELMKWYILPQNNVEHLTHKHTKNHHLESRGIPLLRKGPLP